MFGPIRAVAIDDEPGHLLAITTGLSASGIPCMGYWYDRDTHALRPEPDPSGLPYVRVVFMDLNLEELGGIPEPAALCATVMHVLKQIIPANGGPYLLVFWTQVGGEVEEVKTLLYQRLEGIPFPIAVAELGKGPFLVREPGQQEFKAALREFYSEMHNNIAELEKAVKDAVGRDPQLSAVSLWESRASEAAARAVNEICDCARGDAADPLRMAESIQKVLAKIAVAASGDKAAGESPARALDLGMIDILTDQFGASVDDAGYQDVVGRAIGGTVKGSIAFRDEVRMFAALNTFFHVDTDVSSAKPGDRGVVISAKPFKTNDLGFRPFELLEREFLLPHQTFPESEHARIHALHAEFKQSAEFVLVELGADCDHAQDSARTRRYLLGLEVPVKFFELARYPANKKLRSESLQLLGPWNINNGITYLLVSCGRYWTWQKKEPPPQGKVKYRLRASVLNKLLHHYSVWSSRPGIVEFVTTDSAIEDHVANLVVVAKPKQGFWQKAWKWLPWSS
jgi:hypothetical protein